MRPPTSAPTSTSGAASREGNCDWESERLIESESQRLARSRRYRSDGITLLPRRPRETRIVRASTMTSTRKRLQELEDEIEALKKSTKQALNNSWKDSARLEGENRRLRQELFTAQEQLAFKKKATRRPSSSTAASTGYNTLPKELSIAKETNDDTLSSLRDEGSERESSYLSSWGASAMSAIGIKHHQPTNTERDLLRQLEVLQEDKMRTVQELESKLQQRESSIASLENALRAKEDSFNEMRSELEETLDTLSQTEQKLEREERLHRKAAAALARQNMEKSKREIGNDHADENDEEVARYTANNSSNSNSNSNSNNNTKSHTATSGNRNNSGDDSDVDSTLAHRGDLTNESNRHRRESRSRRPGSKTGRAAPGVDPSSDNSNSNKGPTRSSANNSRAALQSDYLPSHKGTSSQRQSNGRRSFSHPSSRTGATTTGTSGNGNTNSGTDGHSSTTAKTNNKRHSNISNSTGEQQTADGNHHSSFNSSVSSLQYPEPTSNPARTASEPIRMLTRTHTVNGSTIPGHSRKPSVSGTSSGVYSRNTVPRSPTGSARSGRSSRRSHRDSSDLPKRSGSPKRPGSRQAHHETTVSSSSSSRRRSKSPHRPTPSNSVSHNHERDRPSRRK